MTKYPPLTIFNAADEPIGEAQLEEIHKKGLLHRVIMVAVRDSKNRILLQRRGPNVATNPNRWDISAAGYVNANEAYQAAAARELAEETGIKDISLEEIAYYRSNSTVNNHKLNRFIKIYSTQVPSNTKFVIDYEELSGLRWFGVGELKRLLSGQPEEFNNDFNEVLSKITN